MDNEGVGRTKTSHTPNFHSFMPFLPYGLALPTAVCLIFTSIAVVIHYCIFPKSEGYLSYVGLRGGKGLRDLQEQELNFTPASTNSSIILAPAQYFLVSTGG